MRRKEKGTWEMDGDANVVHRAGFGCMMGYFFFYWGFLFVVGWHWIGVGVGWIGMEY